MQQGTVRMAGMIGITAALAVSGSALGLAASNTTRAAAPSPSAACAGSAPKLTVQGTGNASATPNLLTVTVDIDVTGPSARVSLVDDNTKATAVTAVLEQGGVAAKDIQTSNVSISPQYGLAGNVTGYEMTNTLTAELRNFATAGSILDALSTAAGNAAQIDSLTFSIADPRAVEDTARTDAVHQAVSHARSMARAAGERLGPVCSLTDQSTPDFGVEEPFRASAAAPSAKSAVPLQPGTQQETAQITLVYALDQAGTRS
jgi:uncharacterized protein